MESLQSSPVPSHRSRARLLKSAGIAVVLGGTVVIAARSGRGSAATPAGFASIEQDPTYQDAGLLDRSMALPAAAAYASGGFTYQRNGSFCGPATAVNVERSLGSSDEQEHVLEGTGFRTILGYVWGGLTLDEEAELIRNKTGRAVTVLRDLDFEAFRHEIARANDPALRYVANFSRAPLFGRGGGHHSPIGGYLPDRDLVLVLDVNERYGRWLVPTERLFRAVNTVDAATGRRRGLLRVE
ncbi:MAG TPA: phytochelatin synthase family protein [Anaeromyxobacteraceae bacterium]|nr:phytochelatin synthase family protein [Anaeromyxobacteraceae bacterium]